MPEIARIAPVFLLLLPLSSLCSVQNAIFTRQFRFALLSKVNFLSSFVSGLAAVALAALGCGIWSLVAERLLAMGVRAALLWRFSDWHPSGRFSAAPLREMAPFSMSLMATDLISTLYNKLPQFFFGRLYPAATLGVFEQAVKLKDMPTTAAVQSVQSVTFPALAKIGDDAPKFAESYRQVMMVMAYVMFPALLGLSAVARDLFDALLTDKWRPTVPYFEVVCLAGMFYSVGMIAYNVLKIKSRGPLIVRLEVLKKLVMTAVFAVTIPCSVMAVVWGLVVIAFCEMAVQFLGHAALHDALRRAVPPDHAARGAGFRGDVRRGAADGCGDASRARAAAGRGGGRGGLRELPARFAALPAGSFPAGGLPVEKAGCPLRTACFRFG